MSSIRQFAGQTIVYGIGSILSKVVYYLLVVVLLTHLLDGRSFEFGTYGELYGYVTVLIILFSFKLDTALFRFGNKKEDLEEAFNTTASLVLMSSALILFCGLMFTHELASLIDYEDKPQYIRWFSFILAFDVLALIPFARLRLLNKAKLFAGLKIFNVLLSSLLIVFFLIVYPRISDSAIVSWIPQFEYQIDYVFLTNLIASAILLALLLYFVRGFRFKISRPLLKKMLPYVAPLVTVDVCNNIIQYNGAAIIKYLSSGSSLLDNLGQSGIFDSSRRIAGLFVLFTGAFNYAAEPFFFNNSRPEDRESMYGKISHLFVLVGGVLILGMVLGLDLLKIMVGKDFEESFFIIPILLAAYLFLGLYHNFTIWYKLSDKTIWGALISVCGVVLTLIVSFVFIPEMGYEAFAWANLVSYFAMVVLAYLLGQKYYPISYPLKSLFVSILILFLLIVLAVYLKSHLDTAALYVSYGFMFAVFLLYVYQVEKKEWNRILFRNRS